MRVVGICRAEYFGALTVRSVLSGSDALVALNVDARQSRSAIVGARPEYALAIAESLGAPRSQISGVEAAIGRIPVAS